MKFLVFICTLLLMWQIADASPSAQDVDRAVQIITNQDNHQHKSDPLVGATPANPTEGSWQKYQRPSFNSASAYQAYVAGIVFIALIAFLTYSYRFLSTKITKPNSRHKRIALIVFPFLLFPSLVLLKNEIHFGYYGHWYWHPSVIWAILTTGAAICLIFSFSDLEKWITGNSDRDKGGAIE